MKPRLRVLIVDDSDDDTRLLLRELTRAYEVTSLRIETAEDLAAALASGGWQVILCDFAMPHFSGEAALRLVRETGLDVPFIYVSGTIGEEVAVEAMRAGADDYVMKDRLARLLPAIDRELRETEQRRRTEAGLRRQTRMNEALFSQAITCFALFDRDCRLIQVNDSYASYYGKTPADFKGRSVLEVRSATQTLEDAKAMVDEVVRTRAPLRASSYPYVFPDHPERGVTYWDSILQPILDEQGEVEFLFFSSIDVTERRRAEDALRAHAGRLLQQEAALIALTRKEPGERDDVLTSLRRISEVSTRTLGVARVSIWRYNADRTAMLCVDLHELEGDRHSAGTALAVADYPRYFEALAGDDVIATDDVGNEPRFAEIVALVLEEWERKEAEAALRASEQRFRQVTENIDEVFWLTDIDKQEMIYISPAYSRVWGRSCESLARDPQSWMEAVHPEDRERVREAALTRQIAGTYDIDYRIVRPDGIVRWVHDRAFPISDGAGRVYRIAGVAEDITRGRHLEDQLRQSQKMEAIGQLAGGVAHDFNNLLAVIQMQSSLLLTMPSSVAETHEGLQQILAASERAANLTRQLLTFSRRDVRQTKDIDLAEVTDTIAKLLRRILGEDIALETGAAHALPLVNVDPGMMEQVLMNLAVNARDAMPQGGQLLLSLDSVEIGPDEVASRPCATPGRFVRLRVRDTGIGIPPADLPHIFEPFFTTKEAGKGTGLGLATVFGIVEQHQGWIDVTSEIGRGTSFEIFLPALPHTGTTAPETVSEPRLPGGSETILLVEDDAAVRALARVSLEHCGYRVHVAESATAAVELWEGLREPVDLLLTDLIMPGGMSGRELADLLVERQPGLKVIYNSGYSNDVVHRELRLMAGSNYLQKPYPVADLATAVRRCLDGR
jgi:two-component system cell cycle sensor histidine kinase/response regulator CckA